MRDEACIRTPTFPVRTLRIRVDRRAREWRALEGAYGSAACIPGMIAQLTSDSDHEEWDDLWSWLCHQGTTYSASFAALPLLLERAERWEPAARTQVLPLVAHILISGRTKGDRDEFLRPVAWTIPRWQALCRESLAQQGLDADDFIYLLEALCGFEGDSVWGLELNSLPSGALSGRCPHCLTELYLNVGEEGFFTEVAEWVRKPGARQAPIVSAEEPLTPPGPSLHELAVAAGQEKVASWITYVFGTSGCPKCSQPFSVPEAVAA